MKINWDQVTFDAYRLLNNLAQAVPMDLDAQVHQLVQQLKEQYEPS